MQFLYPSILWGLLALLIPIIIHLFYFRRFKNVYFSNVRFLKEIKEETSTRNRLKNLLILLSRLLAFGLLIAAFAQPFIPQGKTVTKGSKEVSLFIDNSHSMRALSSDIPLFDKAVQKAREIISAFSNEDQFQILTHDFAVRQQRLLTKEDALNVLNELTITPEVKSLERIIQRQTQALDGENQSIYILSDFQKSICDIKTPIDSTIDMFFIPFQSVQEKNVAIDSAWLESPVPVLNQNNRVLVKVTNYSDQDVENVRLSINQNGSIKPLGQIDLKARQTLVDTASISIIKSGWQNIELEISDYPVQFDDKYLMSFLVEPSMDVLSLNESSGNNYLNAAFKGLSYFKLDNKSISRFQYSDLKNYKLVILNELKNPSSGLISEISQYVLNGGNVLVFPSKGANKSSYNKLFSSLAVDEMKSLITEEKKVSKINTEEYIFNEVYLRNRRNLKLPVTQSNYEFTSFSNRGRQELLWYRDGSPFMMKYRKEKGHLYICTSPLNADQNDLVKNAEVFIPMLFKMSISKATPDVISYTIGKNQQIEVNETIDLAESTFKINGETEFIPKQILQGSNIILDVDDQISNAGFYSLNFEEQLIRQLSFNFDRTESDLSYHNTEALKEIYEPLGVGIIDDSLNADFAQIVGEKEKGIVLWKWCLIFALIFLAIESLLVRFWK